MLLRSVYGHLNVSFRLLRKNKPLINVTVATNRTVGQCNICALLPPSDFSQDVDGSERNVVPCTKLKLSRCENIPPNLSLFGVELFLKGTICMNCSSELSVINYSICNSYILQL